MSLQRGARIADADEMAEQMEREHSAAQGRRPSRARDAALVLTAVPSVHACYFGYDGIVDRVNDVWLIFNRTALRIQETDLLP